MTSQSSPPSRAPFAAEPIDNPDGRRAWRDRNRLAVVDALLDFYAEGNLRPGAQAVAARSGVSRRSVFRYFEDLDDLDRTAIARQHERVRHLVELPGIGEGPLDERIDRIATCRVALYAAIAPVARVIRTRAPFHAVLGDELALGRKLLCRQVERHFQRELDGLEPGARAEVLAAMDVSCSFESYDLLRATRSLEPQAMAAVLARGLRALLSPAAIEPGSASAPRGMRPW